MVIIKATLCKELTHWKRLWCWEGLGTGGEGAHRGWDGWMASLTRWTWVWVNSGSWWWTGRSGVMRFMGSQRVGHDWATEPNQRTQLSHARLVGPMSKPYPYTMIPFTYTWRVYRPWDPCHCLYLYTSATESATSEDSRSPPRIKKQRFVAVVFNFQYRLLKLISAALLWNPIFFFHFKGHVRWRDKGVCCPPKWVKWSRSVMSDSLPLCGLQPARLLHPQDFPGKSSGEGFHFLLQGIFLTQGSNPGLPHCRQTPYREPPAKPPRFISNEDVGYSKRKFLTRNPGLLEQL